MSEFLTFFVWGVCATQALSPDGQPINRFLTKRRNLMLQLFTELMIGAGQDLFNTAVGALVAFAIGKLILDRIREYRYGGWIIEVKDGDKILGADKISAQTAQNAFSDTHLLRQFLKSNVSTYTFINTDLITTGVKIGLLKIDYKARTIVIDISKNPPKAGAKPS